MMEFMRLNWPWMLSFGTFMAAVLGYVYVRLRALSLGLQALLRAQMINDYNRYTAKGYAPIYARQSFEDCWRQYKALGGNGVMTELHEKFFALPTEPRKEGA